MFLNETSIKGPLPPKHISFLFCKDRFFGGKSLRGKKSEASSLYGNGLASSSGILFRPSFKHSDPVII